MDRNTSAEPLNNSKMHDFTTGLIKAAVFGTLISGLACYLGLGVTGGAQGVGVATTRTVVLTIVALITVDLVVHGSVLFYGALRRKCTNAEVRMQNEERHG